MSLITWNVSRDSGSHLRCVLRDENVKALMTRVEAMGAKNVGCNDDGYETLFAYIGRFRGHLFVLYDRDGTPRIGGTDALDIDALCGELGINTQVERW